MFKAQKINKSIVRKHKDWQALSCEEKKKTRKEDEWGLTIYKNTFPGWNSVDISLFVTDELQDEIILPKLNKINYNEIGMRHKWNLFQDKNYQPSFAKEMRFPQSVIHCIDGQLYDDEFRMINSNIANSILNSYDALVFKKTLFSGHGEGVILCHKGEYGDLIGKNWGGGNYIVQKVIRQCSEFAQFNESSVNVVRMTTLFWNGQVYILGGILRIGAPGSFCDHTGYNNVNPRVVGIHDDGKLYDYCIDPDGEIMYKECFGKKTDGALVPKYEEMKQQAISVHKHYPHNRIIGWDFTVDRNEEVICIEYNPDQPGIIQTQMAIGPIFNRITRNNKTILQEILES